MIFRIQSFKQAAFWSTAIGAFGQGLALLFGMLMAACFGAQESTDVFYYCLGVFGLLTALIQQINMAVLVPETMRRREQTGEADAMAFINRFFAVFCLVALALTALILVRPATVLTAISRFPAGMLEREHRVVFWLAISFPLQMVAQLLLDILVSYRFLALPAVLSCMGRLINIGFVLGFHREWGVLSAAAGMVIGFGLQVLVNAWILRRAIHWRWTVWRTRIGGVVYRNILWTELGTVAAVLAGYLPLFLFTGFSAGAVTALNYAQRLSRVPLEVLTSQFSSVMAVKFNEQMARCQETEMSESFGRLARLGLFILMPLGVWMAVTGPDWVTILFGRGKFQGEALRLAALMFSIFVLNLPLTGVLTVMSRFLIARQAIRYGVLWQVFSCALNMAVVALAVHFWGPVGFPVGSCVHLLLYLLIISASMARRYPRLPLGAVWRSFLVTATACAGAGGAVVFLRVNWGMGLSSWALCAGSTAAFACLYGAWLWLWPPDRMALRYFLETAGTMRLKAMNGWRALRVGSA
jgi:putative peptidoglycan lipid II flippase